MAHIVAESVAAVTSGILLFAAFPSFNLAWLAWVGLVPMMVVVARANPFRAFVMAYACGAAFFLGLFNWIRVVSGYTPLHHALLAVYLGFFFAVFGLLTAIVRRRMGLGAALWAAPFLWVPLEFVRSNMGFLALPWGLLGHTQYSNHWVVQSASAAGVYGISFLIVAVNAAIAGLVCLYLPVFFRNIAPKRRPADHRRILALSAVALCFFALSILWGRAVFSKPIAGKHIKLALVQGNIDQAEKWNPENAKAIMQVYGELTRKAASSAPDLIVWPESATPRSIMVDRRILNQVQELAHASQAPLLIGSSTMQKFNVKRPEETKYVNSAFLIEPVPGRRPNQRYDKIRLFPFGEYLPYKEKLPWASIGVPDIDHYLAGRDYSLFDLDGIRFAVPICWENLFPQMVRRFAREGAQFIVNITNEAWFGDTSAPYQFLAMNVFRAVESNLYVVRCTNTGISCIVDPRGRITGRVRDSDGRDILVSGILLGEVKARRAETMYVRYGDWLVWLCALAATAFFLACIKRRNNA